MAKKAVTRLFSREFMEELNDYPCDLRDKTFLYESRWANHYEGVFDFEGSTWQVQWQEGATEYQEGEDAWYDQKEIEATKVVKLPVVKYEWTPVYDV